MVSLSAPVAISYLTEVEFASALSRRVRMEEIDDAQAGIIEQAFFEDRKSGLFKRVSFTVAHYNQAIKCLSLRNTSLCALDTLHLALSHYGNLTIVSSDEILSKSAEKLGAACYYLSE